MEPDPLASGPRRVEAYLDQILAPLARSLSPFHREELRRELREHLWARIEAYRKADHSEDEAVTEALRQFGGAEDFLRQWRREWSGSVRRLTLWDVYEAGRQAILPAWAGIAGTFLLFIVLEAPFGSRVAPALWSHYYTVLHWAVMGLGLLILPVFMGVKQGRRTPERAGVGMLAALTAALIATGLLYAITNWAVPDDSNSETPFALPLELTLAWLPVTSGAAAISGWWTRRSQARRLA